MMSIALVPESMQESPADRRHRQGWHRDEMARNLYYAVRDITDPDWPLLTQVQQEPFRQAARGVFRRLDAAVLAVAEERAAAAMAEGRGWTWPDLDGYAVAPGADLAEARREMRGHLRAWAQLACRAFERHCLFGGREDTPHRDATEWMLIKASIHEDSMSLADRVARRRAHLRQVASEPDGRD